MPQEFKFPDVGEGITEGEIVKWHVKEGDTVKEHDVIVDIETDKAIVNVPSPYSGKVLKINHKEGDTIKVGEVLVVVGGAGEKASATPPKSAPAAKPKPTTKTKRPQKGVGVVGELPEAPEEPEEPKLEVPLAPIKAIAQVSKENVMATPAIRRLARDLGLDLSKIEGNGLGGRITEEDVRTSVSMYGKKGKGVKAPAAKSKTTTVVKIQKKYDFYGFIERIPLKGIRKATAKRMIESAFSIPGVTHMDDADVTELWKLREKEKGKAKKKGIHLTFLPFIVKAVIAALKEFPHLNASLDEEHEEILLKKYYNIGIAVDTGSGLIVPVIKEAQDKSILQIAKEIQVYAKKAMERKIDLAEMKGNTFTITNIGVIGGRYATPIINPPDAAIIAVGRIRDEVRIIGDKVKKQQIRKILPISITFDHRIVDGAYTARFSNTIIEHLEDPQMLLMEE